MAKSLYEFKNSVIAKKHKRSGRYTISSRSLTILPITQIISHVKKTFDWIEAAYYYDLFCIHTRVQIRFQNCSWSSLLEYAEYPPQFVQCPKKCFNITKLQFQQVQGSFKTRMDLFFINLSENNFSGIVQNFVHRLSFTVSLGPWFHNLNIFNSVVTSQSF